MIYVDIPLATELTSIEKPLVFRGLVDGWRKRRTAWFAERIDASVTVVPSDGVESCISGDPARLTRLSVPLSWVWLALQGCTTDLADVGLARGYLAQCPLDGMLHGLARSVPPPVLLDAVTVEGPPNLWANWGGIARTGLHYDDSHGLLAVVAGEKRVILFAPSTGCRFNARPAWHPAAHHVDIDPRAANCQADTALWVGVAAWTATLSPGDALFIPQGWWHQVDSCDATIAINFWFSVCTPAQATRNLDDIYFETRLLEAETTRQRVEGATHAAQTLAITQLQPLTLAPPALLAAQLEAECLQGGCWDMFRTLTASLPLQTAVLPLLPPAVWDALIVDIDPLSAHLLLLSWETSSSVADSEFLVSILFARDECGAQQQHLLRQRQSLSTRVAL